MGDNACVISSPSPPPSRIGVPQEADATWSPIRDAAGSLIEEHELDYIMDQRGLGADAQCLVKWRGTPEDQATWEPAHHLTGCPALLHAWHRRQLRHLQDRHHAAPPET
ncbi:hypothetical protein ENH_00052930 [Eimeria necatrix]|uniref:Chromo domain-containing protein n=1 Tax=Eimeria necatrix TaxID=51315 RepID=U6MQB1_9EIME|nr:hypothetical protein ENH_00052930 [Eimeria necatrix]CDJ63855.1 hypothetical protein ENH_00052930 [Eimeria necatrix]